MRFEKRYILRFSNRLNWMERNIQVKEIEFV